MNCYQHPTTPAVAYCRSCGRPLCQLCQRPAEGTVFCPEHAPAAPGVFDASNPYAPGTASPLPQTGVRTSPALAFILGWIPGVGAIYNGQYIKGLVHAVIFGLLSTLIDSNSHSAGGPFFGIMMAAYEFYMAFEAYHTAKKRQLGIPVTEWSSLAASQPHLSSRTPAGPILLIAVGVIFLLDTMHLVEFREIVRFWPVLLIVAGAFMLYSRVSGLSAPPPSVASSDPFASSSPVRNINTFMETGREQ